MIADRHEQGDCWTRYTLAERRVTARAMKRQVVEGQVCEICSSGERLVGFISPHFDRWAAYVHRGYGYMGLGFFDTREEALEAVSSRFDPSLVRRIVRKA